jgi:GNAT superfamily N-acetyltransferase
VTRDLTLRLEAAEAAYCEAKLRALEADGGNARGVEIARLGGSVLLSIQSARYNPSYNRAMCFSQGDAAHLDEILAWLRDRSDRFWFDVAPALVDETVTGRLAGAGLYPSFFLNVVYTAPGVPVEREWPAIVIEETGPDRARDFAVVLSAGFGIPSEAVEHVERTTSLEYAAPGWRTYLATLDGHPAAVAVLYTEGAIASIDAMATDPRYRNRGCQTALLRRCIADAARAGCELVASQTRPGGASERNMTRAGFRVAYTKLLYSEREQEAG